MRILQGILFVIGGAALGTVLGFLGLAILVDLLQAPGGEPSSRGFGQYIGGLICGAPVGAITGLAGSLVYYRAQSRPGTWTLAVWGGMAMGLAIGASIAFNWSVAREFAWLGTTLLLLGGSTAGGLLASIGATIYESTKRSR